MRGFRRLAAAAIVFTFALIVLGGVVVLTGVPLWGAVVHQATGTLVFAALAFAFLRSFARRQRFGPG